MQNPTTGRIAESYKNKNPAIHKLIKNRDNISGLFNLKRWYLNFK